MWTVTDLVKHVNGRTDGKASGKPDFDLRMEFFLGMDELCGEKHYWWRRKAFSFPTVVGTQDYDLNSTTGANVQDVAEIEELFVVNSSPNAYPGTVDPSFSASQFIAALYGNASVNQLAAGQWLWKPGTYSTLRLSAPAQSVVTVAGTYWAVPMNTDPTVEVIPLVPPHLHYGLVYMLERRVYEYLGDTSSARAILAEKRYADFLKIMAKNKSFSSQAAKEARYSGPAIVSAGR